jgi:hypothetical protein
MTRAVANVVCERNGGPVSVLLKDLREDRIVEHVDKTLPIINSYARGTRYKRVRRHCDSSVRSYAVRELLQADSALQQRAVCYKNRHKKSGKRNDVERRYRREDSY